MALSGAQISHDHEGRGCVGPALADIWATGLFAYRMEAKSLNDIVGRQVFGRAWGLNLEPRGLSG